MCDSSAVAGRPARNMASAFTAALLNGCSTVPVTGRSQLDLMSAGEELQLGLTSFAKLKTETPVRAWRRDAGVSAHACSGRDAHPAIAAMDANGQGGVQAGAVRDGFTD